ncbi:MAG: IS21 family transposase, partial [Chloroflexi bacterium]|nr:IS21 family transposase [Chloroflexota bacterium]
RANVRFHRGIRARPIDRLVHEGLRPLPEALPDLDRRWVLRVPPQPYVRVDTVDYSLDPRLVGRRVEVRVSQSEVSAVALDTGELACRHGRTFARHVTVTALEHKRALEEMRAERRREVAVETRALERYDRVIPA